MTIRTTLISSPWSENRRRYDIAGSLTVEVEVTGNPLGLPLDALFGMAARKNKKRGFLFVSKVLGKHIPVPPQLALLAGRALAELLVSGRRGESTRELLEIGRAMKTPEASERLYERLAAQRLPVGEETLFIGFAETATALGHGMFAAFEGPVAYVHTTREIVPDRSVCVAFEEEHSHATSHRCYMDDPRRFASAGTIVLVDDELTTGKTALNIIGDLKRKYGSSRYVIASLLDWRSDADRERFAAFEAEWGVTIETISLLSGKLAAAGEPAEGAEDGRSLRPAPASGSRWHTIDLSDCFALSDAPAGEMPYMLRSGRFSLDAMGQTTLDEEIGRAAALCRAARTGERVLCMGTGEFMYIPMRIAAELGGGVLYQSTTRSPIHPIDSEHYAVRNGWSFQVPDHPELLNYMYNISEGSYDELFLFMERRQPLTVGLELALRDLNVPTVHLVYCAKEAEPA